MALEVDRARCEGHGICVGIVPDLIEVDDDGKAHPLPGRENLSGPADIRLAVDSCPARALRMT